MTKLGLALAAYQQKHDIDGKMLAAEIGIGESTLTRLKQGKKPDADGLLKVIVWMVQGGDE